MSQVKIQGNASGTGIFTVASPNSNTDRTLTLPDNAGTILTSASNLVGLTGVGKVLQAVNATTTNGGSYISTTSTSFVTTGLSASITPTSSTSKIFICFTGVGQGAGSNGRFTIFRNSTNLGSSSGFTQSNVAGRWVPLAMNFLDSPSTTSSTAYAVYYLNSGGDITYFGGDGQTCSITLMEIAA